MKFGDVLKEYRTSRGYTQAKLANELHVSQMAISTWENGTREPNFETVRQIASFFNTPVSAFMQSDETTNRELANLIEDTINQNPKIGILFEKVRYLSESDLDAIITIVNALSKEREPII